MIRKVDIYIEGNVTGDYEKIELFNDEKIVINSSIQNVQDISKVFTDFSQSFTIPASSTNNRIAHYFYETDVDVELDTNGMPLWNPNYKRRAFIEIDTIPFRTGKVAIEKAQIVNGKIESYTLGFYGDLVSLKDVFGTLKLSDLDYSAFDYTYDYDNVKLLVQSTSDFALRFPLISSDKVWSYGNGTNTDITTNTGAIRHTELFPALKVSVIFQVIQSYFGVTFTGNWLLATNKRWNNLFLWLKNAETYKNTTNLISVNFNRGQVSSIYGTDNYNENTPPTKGKYLNLTTNELIIAKTLNAAGSQLTYVQAWLYTSTPCQVTVEIFKNGVYFKSITFDSNTQYIIYSQTTSNNNGEKLTFKYYTDIPIFGKFGLKATLPFGNYNKHVYMFDDVGVTGVASTNINKFMPDMTVADFFASILKTFNLTCYATSSNTFRLEPLDDFYSRGAVIDITKLVSIDNIEVAKTPIYKTLTFEHAKSENFLNQAYYENNKKTREFGDAKVVDANLDNGEFSVKTGFSDMLMTNLNSGLCVGYSLGKYPSYEKQIPPPLLLYMDTIKTGVSFKMSDGAGRFETLTSYAPFTQETTYNGQKYSLHFSDEYSVVDNTPLFNNLYATYYSSWLNNLYNPKCRITSVDVQLPTSLLTNLKLYDRVIIRDKRYTINDMKIDLTTGEAKLNLLNDFRPVKNTTFVVVLETAGGTILLDVIVPDGGQVCLSTTGSGVTFNQTCFTDDGMAVITYPANPHPITNINAENADTLISENYLNIVTEESDTVGFPVSITTTYPNGTTEVQTIYVNYDN